MASWKPVDSVIETKNSAITLNPAVFSASATRFLSSAGAQSGQNNFEPFTVSNSSGSINSLAAYTQFIIKDGNTTPTTLNAGSATTIGTDKVVLIKQSRTDPQVAVVEIFSRGSGSAANGDPVLNGAVYTEGRIGGLSGVNIQRKTIAGRIQETGATNSGDALGPKPNGTSATLNITDNIWQYGTNPRDSDPNVANKPAGADHGLGLVAEWINVNADTNNWGNYVNGSIPGNNRVLTIYATMLAGRKNGASSTGGLTVGKSKFDGAGNLINDGVTTQAGISSSSMGSNKTPIIRTVGGQILANYYARINLGGGRSGWNSAAIYDQQLALKPPPFFPNDGGLNPLTYVEERIWSGR